LFKPVDTAAMLMFGNSKADLMEDDDAMAMRWLALAVTSKQNRELEVSSCQQAWRSHNDSDLCPGDSDHQILPVSFAERVFTTTELIVRSFSCSYKVYLMWHNWTLYLLPNLDLVCSVHMLALRDLSVFFFFSRTLRQDVLILVNNFLVPAIDNLLS
jgi:hypothetical protein